MSIDSLGTIQVFAANGKLYKSYTLSSLVSWGSEGSSPGADPRTHRRLKLKKRANQSVAEYSMGQPGEASEVARELDRISQASLPPTSKDRMDLVADAGVASQDGGADEARGATTMSLEAGKGCCNGLRNSLMMLTCSAICSALPDPRNMPSGVFILGEGWLKWTSGLMS